MTPSREAVHREPLSRPTSKPPIPDWLIVVVVLFVLFTWAGSIVYSASNPAWPIPPSVHAVVVPVVVGTMGYLALRGRRNGNGSA